MVQCFIHSCSESEIQIEFDLHVWCSWLFLFYRGPLQPSPGPLDLTLRTHDQASAGRMREIFSSNKSYVLSVVKLFTHIDKHGLSHYVQKTNRLDQNSWCVTRHRANVRQKLHFPTDGALQIQCRFLLSDPKCKKHKGLTCIIAHTRPGRQTSLCMLISCPL